MSCVNGDLVSENQRRAEGVDVIRFGAAVVLVREVEVEAQALARQQLVVLAERRESLSQRQLHARRQAVAVEDVEARVVEDFARGARRERVSADDELALERQAVAVARREVSA